MERMRAVRCAVRCAVRAVRVPPPKVLPCTGPELKSKSPGLSIDFCLCPGSCPWGQSDSLLLLLHLPQCTPSLPPLPLTQHHRTVLCSGTLPSPYLCPTTTSPVPGGAGFSEIRNHAGG